MSPPNFSLTCSLKQIQRGLASVVPPRRIARLLRNILFDLRFGAFLGGRIVTPYRHLGSTNTENTDYAALDAIFEGELDEDDILVDMGCGKGRVLNWWLRYYPKNRIYGVEWNDAVASRTRKRLAHFPTATIISGSAIEHIPPDANVFYLFNPFRKNLMDEFREKIASSRGKSSTGKPIRIYYYNPVEVGQFLTDARFEVSMKNLPTHFHGLAIVTFAT